MQYKLLTDYAVKALLLIAASPNRITVGELAARLSTSKTTVANVMRVLRSRSKWVKSLTGIEGGYLFTSDLARITLYDVHKAMGDVVKKNSVLSAEDALLSKVYDELSLRVKAFTAQITLKDLLENQSEAQISAYMAGLNDIGQESDVLQSIKELFMTSIQEKEAEVLRLKMENAMLENRYRSLCRQIDEALASCGKGEEFGSQLELET